MDKCVYLAGPISGVPPGICAGWRAHAKKRLESVAAIIDPLRDDPDYSVGRQGADAAARLAELVHCQRMIARDRWDIARCTVLLACFLDAKCISVGTVGEIFWADAWRKLIVIVRAPGNPHDTPFLNAITPWVFDELDPAIDKITVLLG